MLVILQTILIFAVAFGALCAKNYQPQTTISKQTIYKYKQNFYAMGCFLTNSSVGKKLVMSISGCFLVLFILFHMSMNLTMIFSREGYNLICEFLGANWYALAGTALLAAGVLVHFVYAFILTINNYRARGKQRYAVTVQEKGVSWASKNMLVLGMIVILGLGLHLVHFWSKMQLVEVAGCEYATLTLDGVTATAHPANGALLMAFTFSKWSNVVIYLLWFHLTHGVWSMFQSAGFANDTWYPRLKCLANIVATLILLGFAIVVVVCYFKSGEYFTEMANWHPAH